MKENKLPYIYRPSCKSILVQVAIVVHDHTKNITSDICTKSIPVKLGTERNGTEMKIYSAFQL